MKSKQEVLAFVRHLQHLYWEERDMEALIPYFDESTSWIGTGRHEICYNLGEAVQALREQAEECPSCFTLREQKYEVFSLAYGIYGVYGEFSAVSLAEEMSDVCNRISLVCAEREDGMKLLHFHMSKPDLEQTEGSYFAKKENGGTKEELKARVEETSRILHKKESELEALTVSVPGGLYRCRDDGKLTLLTMSGSFLEMFGYTREEIRTWFNDSFIEMVYEEDRRRIRSEMDLQLAKGSTVELEYRIAGKDGGLRWILDKGVHVQEDGEAMFYCVLLDITEQKKEREELRLSLERHKLIMNQTTDIIFEWDIEEDELKFSSNWKKKFGYNAIHYKISDRIPLSENIYPADMPAFIKIMRDTAEGVPYSETEFRIRGKSGDYIWCLIRATTQFNAEGRAVRAVGVIIDIDQSRKQKECLVAQASLDSLTGLLNKKVARERIENWFLDEEMECGAFILIDLDDFKQINDRYGHLCGDRVLSEIAEIMKSQTRRGDVTARIGGDEFLAYLPGATEMTAAEVVRRLQEAVSALQLDGRTGEVRASVGASFYPKDGKDYLTLFAKADQALYFVKKRDKNKYYTYEMLLEEHGSAGKCTAWGTLIESDIPTAGDNDSP